jgi:hypothetical protein
MQTQTKVVAEIRVLRILVIVDLVMTLVLAVAVIQRHPEMAAGMMLAVGLVTMGILAVAHRIGGKG